MNKQTNDIFSRRLRQARMMKGFSLEKLSQCVTPAITRQAINKYEKGLMMPDSRVLIALATALGVKIDYFFRPFTVEVDRVEFRKKPKFPSTHGNGCKGEGARGTGALSGGGTALRLFY